MLFIRSLVFKYHTHSVTLILSLSVIMSIYSYYTEKKLIYVIITVSFSCQPSSYSKCIKLNIYSSYNIRSVFNAKYIFLMRLANY